MEILMNDCRGRRLQLMTEERAVAEMGTNAQAEKEKMRDCGRRQTSCETGWRANPFEAGRDGDPRDRP